MGSHLPFVVFVWKFIAARTLFTARGDRPPSALPSSVGVENLPLGGRFECHFHSLQKRISRFTPVDFIERKRGLIAGNASNTKNDGSSFDLGRKLRQRLLRPTLEFGFHPVELGNIGFLEPHGFGRCVRHRYHREAVFGHEVHWPGFALFIEVFSPLKIEGAK